MGGVSIEQRGKRERLADAWDGFADAAAEGGHKNDAVAYLRNAVQAGYHDVNDVRRDEKLVSLHNDPRFQQIVTAMQRQAKANK